jgi:Fe-S oxidoreductase
VAVFATCYVNYNEPGIGHDLLGARHNGSRTCWSRRRACCGMPKLELGDLESVERSSARTSQAGELAREGYAILSAIPSCTLMFKQELPLMFPDDAAVQAVQGRRCSTPSSTSWRATRTAC